MGTANTLAVRSPAIRSASVGRKRTKPVKLGEQMHLSFLVDAEIVQAADHEADRLTREHDIAVTRTDVIRRWLKEAARRSRTR
jgi:hypothetical protein